MYYAAFVCLTAFVVEGGDQGDSRGGGKIVLNVAVERRGRATRRCTIETTSPLLICAVQNAQAAATLLKYGAQVNRATEDGLTPLHEAASAGSVEVAEILVRAGAKVSQDEGTSTYDCPLSVIRLAVIMVNLLL